MKLKYINLFGTPANWRDLQSWIERHPVSERAHLYTAACMAWNLACYLQDMPDPEDGEPSEAPNSHPPVVEYDEEESE